MMSRERRRGSTLVPAPRAEHCLDFANTLSWRGDALPSEALSSLGDLLAWCTSREERQKGEIDRFGRWWRGDPEAAAAAFAEAIELREGIFRIFSAVASSVKPAAVDLSGLNRALAAGPKRIRLARAGDGYAWRVDRPQPSIPALLAPVLWSAGDLLTQPMLVQRVRQCANEKCRWLFLDDSKSGSRRWCSMNVCGNRAKARRHYLRTKES
jgi:predicted RNA-binding Zn ribbon-like protein